VNLAAGGHTLRAVVTFDWSAGAPTGMGVDTFSVRWTGQVQPCYSQTYTFYTSSDDGVRLWVNGQQVIANWTDHGPTENSGTIALTAGQKYDVGMEFYENGGGAVASLSWSSASQATLLYPPVSRDYSQGVDVHYTVNGGSQLNYLTYEKGGAGSDSPVFSYTH
jgi:hypothetical protein